MSYQDIFTAEVSAHVRDGAHLYDVREIDEYVQGHIPGAISIPLSELAGREDMIQTPAIMVCLSGGRSAQAARHLAAQGKQDVMNLNGGTMGWISEGREVTEGTNP